jgi:hypothetical protein
MMQNYLALMPWFCSVVLMNVKSAGLKFYPARASFAVIARTFYFDGKFLYLQQLNK